MPKLPILVCKRCDWKWIPRIEKVEICPKCKSARWNEKKEVKKG